MKKIHKFINTLRDILRPPSYGSALQQYIISRNPQNNGDIERYTRDWLNAQRYYSQS